MKLRYKLNLTIIAAAVGSSLAISAVFLRLQKSAIEKSEAEKIDLILDETRKTASESILARDSLMLMDHLDALRRDRPEVISCKINIRGKWNDIGPPPSEKDIAESFEKEIRVENVRAAIRFSSVYIAKQKQKAIKNATDNLAIAMSVVCILSIIAAWALSWSLTRRLDSLSDEIKKVGEGKLGAVTPVKGSDEIADLAEKFNDMSKKLLELEQMKKTFISSVTHELRSPLGAIESYVRMMLADERYRTPTEKNNLIRIQENAARLSHFVTTLLDLSRIERGKMDLALRIYEPTALIQDTVAFFLPKAKESGLELKTDVSENIPPMMLDPDLMGHVLTNLISNALKFTPKNGQITVSAAMTTPQVLYVSVKDTGVGISKADARKLFAPFERIRNPLNAKGTGLGLALAKGIVELHGGKLGVESEPGKGSTFWFEIPAKPR